MTRREFYAIFHKINLKYGNGNKTRGHRSWANKSVKQRRLELLLSNKFCENKY